MLTSQVNNINFVIDIVIMTDFCNYTDTLINHDKKDDFAHNNQYVRIKCPVCLLYTKNNRIHMYHNTSGLWWHIRTEHRDMQDSQQNEIAEILKKVSVAVHLGML